MTAAKNYEIVGSYNNQRVSEIDSERTVNMFEYLDAKAKKPRILLPTAGLVDSEVELPGVSNGWRASFYFNGFFYAVVGQDIYKVNSDLIGVQINIVGTTVIPLSAISGYVGVDANTHEVIFVDGTHGYIYDTTTSTFSQITDVNFPAQPIDVCFIDGFFVVAAGGTNTFVMSQINAGTNYTPLQQGAITSHPGTITGCRTLHRRVFLFSQFFTEVWENAGIGTNLPLRRRNEYLIEYGTQSPGNIATGFDKMFFLSQDRDGLGAVMQVNGTQAIPISTRALDSQLAAYAANPLTGVMDARGFLVKINGLIFYRLNFTLANHTFVYNVTLSNPEIEEGRLWHEEEVLNGNRHPAQTHVYFNGINYYGDYLSPLLYIVDSAVSTNNGESIKRMRIGAPWSTPEGYVRTRIDRFHLDLVQGSIEEVYSDDSEIDLLAEDGDILLTESGIDLLIENAEAINDQRFPVVFLSYSKDGGQSYGNRLDGPMGQIGQRSFRTVWRKLGVVPRGQTYVPKIEFFNQIPFVILGSAWNAEMMPE